MKTYDLLIVGGGAAGMAAALEAKRLGVRSVCLCERSERLGGVLPQCIHKGFGLGYFKEDLTGPEYAQRFITKLQNSDIAVYLETTVLSLSPEKTAVISSPKGLEHIVFEKMILATGCRERAIGTLPITGSRPAGIFTAGSAQKMVNLHNWDIGGNIVILGSGDIGMIMARRLKLKGKNVIALIEQSDRLGGLERNRRNCIEAQNIPVHLGSTITKLHGWPRLCAVTMKSGEKEAFIPCDTLIVAVGLIPEQELIRPFGCAIPAWLRLCGNCDTVHEIVDSVSFQAEKAVQELFSQENT